MTIIQSLDPIVHTIPTVTASLNKFKKGKGHPCTGTEALYRAYGP